LNPRASAGADGSRPKQMARANALNAANPDKSKKNNKRLLKASFKVRNCFIPCY
jgi:hypothetical protein